LCRRPGHFCPRLESSPPRRTCFTRGRINSRRRPAYSSRGRGHSGARLESSTPRRKYFHARTDRLAPSARVLQSRTGPLRSAARIVHSSAQVPHTRTDRPASPRRAVHSPGRVVHASAAVLRSAASIPPSRLPVVRCLNRPPDSACFRASCSAVAMETAPDPTFTIVQERHDRARLSRSPCPARRSCGDRRLRGRGPGGWGYRREIRRMNAPHRSLCALRSRSMARPARKIDAAPSSLPTATWHMPSIS
jgi:hypothetical protein